MEQQNNADDELARHVKLIDQVSTFSVHVTQVSLTVNRLNHTVELLMELFRDQEQRIKRLEERESTDDARSVH